MGSDLGFWLYIAGLISVLTVMVRWSHRGGHQKARRAAIVFLLFSLVALVLDLRFFDPGFGRPRVCAVLILDVSGSMAAEASELLAPGVWRPENWPPPEAESVLVYAANRRWVRLFEGEPDNLPERFGPPAGLDEDWARSGFDLAFVLRDAETRRPASEDLLVDVVSDGGVDELSGGSMIPRRPGMSAPRRHNTRAAVSDNAAVYFPAPARRSAASGRFEVDVAVFGHVRDRRVAEVQIEGGPAVRFQLSPLSPLFSATLEAPDSARDNDGYLRVFLDFHQGWDRRRRDDSAQTTLPDRPHVPHVLVAGASRDWTGVFTGRARVSFRDQIPSLVDLQGVDVLVLADLPLDSLTTSASFSGLTRFATGGGGLVLLGVRQAFAKGGYSGTPVDDLSPLAADPEAPPLDLTVLLDHSGSMERDDRWRRAARAVTDMTRRLRPADHLRVITLGGDLRELEFQGPDSESVLAALLALSPRGGTDLEAAYRLAMAKPRNTAARSLMLVLSDLESPTFNTSLVEEWVREARRQEVPIHVFWFDRRDNLVPLAERLTSATGGRLVEVNNFGGLAAPLLEPLEAEWAQQEVSVSTSDGRRVVVPEILRTRRKSEAIVLAGGESADLSAAARVQRGQGHVLALPIPADEKTLNAVFGSAEKTAETILSTGILQRDGLSARVEWRNQRPRLVLSTPKQTTAIPAFLDAGAQKHRLEQTGACRFETPPLTPEDLPDDPVVRVSFADGSPAARVFLDRVPPLDGPVGIQESKVFTDAAHSAERTRRSNGLGHLVLSLGALLVFCLDLWLRSVRR